MAEQNPNPAEMLQRVGMGAGLAVGMGVGVALGVSIDNIVLGVVIGVAIGAGVMMAFIAAGNRLRQQQIRQLREQEQQGPDARDEEKRD